MAAEAGRAAPLKPLEAAEAAPSPSPASLRPKVSQAKAPLSEARAKAVRAAVAARTESAEADGGLYERDSYSATAMAEVLDRATHATLAKLTMGLSPASLTGAYLDWLTHLAAAPGKRLQLAEKAARKAMKLQRFAMRCALMQNGHVPCIDPLPQDQRFNGDAWQKWPYNLFYQSHLLMQQWWTVATTGVPGVSAQHERMLEFTARQILDVFSPSNFIWTNPEILQATARQSGMNFVRGWHYFVEDMERTLGGQPPPGAEKFRPGREVAITPGKVVYRNRLMELIQYAPSTGSVYPEPILIVPAWIMKYYILDLSPQNSMIKYLVDQGFTVFAISWKNPDPSDRDVGFDDYRRMGVMAALDAVRTIMPETKVHGAGYCLGGTLLAIAAAAADRNGTAPFETLTFLASQIDFKEPGELQLFINESQLSFLEDMMWEQGFLDAGQMTGAFQMLRSNDLVWSRIMHEYLMGERAPMIDLMAWNADSTRMPYRMHSEYLRRLYLNNDLAEGRFKVDGRPVLISDIREPVFAVGTVKDHVAPWRSVYKWNALSDTDVTFVLTAGGHNAGIVSEPGRRNRSYQVGTRAEHDFFIDADSWAARTPVKEGSWWPEWAQWLKRLSGDLTPPPPMGAAERDLPPLEDAPGTYIHMR